MRFSGAYLCRIMLLGCSDSTLLSARERLSGNRAAISLQFLQCMTFTPVYLFPGPSCFPAQPKHLPGERVLAAQLNGAFPLLPLGCDVSRVKAFECPPFWRERGWYRDIFVPRPVNLRSGDFFYLPGYRQSKRIACGLQG